MARREAVAAQQRPDRPEGLRANPTADPRPVARSAAPQQEAPGGGVRFESGLALRRRQRDVGVIDYSRDDYVVLIGHAKSRLDAGVALEAKSGGAALQQWPVQATSVSSGHCS